jgi:uncharacterized membrane protein YoaK (UPF0700 family)
MSTTEKTATHIKSSASGDAAKLSHLETSLPTLLSIIAGMVDLIGFLSFGIFTAHITGNIVVIGALVVRRVRVNPAQFIAIPVFVLAVTATWLIAKASSKRGASLVRLLLLIQFLLITCLLIFSVITKPSANPRSTTATITAMIAVTSMGCQFALLRVTMPVAPSTAVMTGNLTNAVLAFLNSSSQTKPLILNGRSRPRGSLRLLAGFFFGCVTAAAAVTYMSDCDWAWSLPALLAAVAVSIYRQASEPNAAGVI